jgi:hypothetical protein
VPASEQPMVTSPLGPIMASNKLSAGRIESKIRNTLTLRSVTPRPDLLRGISAEMPAVRLPQTGSIRRDLVERELAKRG